MTPLSLLFASEESFRILSALLFLLTSLCFIILMISLLPKKNRLSPKDKHFFQRSLVSGIFLFCETHSYLKSGRI